ncbi:MAG TPA: lipopolysaccharide biosynthesis protein [Kouleothrix sp.]|uniref:lipopolysaccharide biosynthesis protein n=1 Tax=Kouleothrix sp. TaxID=2779161 RepID=UPI002BA9C0DE|nr:lipopolysaccharide biosynthesis protein [Kouleothrix sp.]
MIRLIILRVFESYFRHRWLNLLPVLMMIVAAGGYISLSKPEFASRGTLYVQKSSLLSSLTQIQNDGISWSTPTQIALNELSELLQTDAFIRSAIKKTDLEAKMSGDPSDVTATMDDFRTAIQVQMVGDNLIEISALNRDPVLAQQLAQATIDAYTQWKLNGDQQESAVAQSFFAQVIPPYQQELQKNRDDLKVFLQTHPQPLRGERPPEEQVQLSQLQSAINSASTRLENALEKEESARLAQSQAESNVRQNYLLIDAPIVPLKPERSLRTMALSAAIFVVAGIVLSIVGVIGGALLDRSFRFAIDVRNGLDLPVLALVPNVGRLPAVLPVAQGMLASLSQAASAPAAQTQQHDDTLAVGLHDQAVA